MAAVELLTESIEATQLDEEFGLIRVLIVDDHQVVREGLWRILELDEGVRVVGDAENGEEAIAKAVSLLPDVVIMDLKMPGMDGITATRELKQRLPSANILILTLYAEDFVRQAIEAGASGYLLKDSDCEQIISAVHQVYHGLCPIAPSLTRDLVTEFNKLSRDGWASLLTRRQEEILRLVSEGMGSRDIGSRLFISLATVKREMRQIFNKLEVNDRPQAVSEAIKRKLI
jgi:DNA-binding NarL/FixJ family response regulator